MNVNVNGNGNGNGIVGKKRRTEIEEKRAREGHKVEKQLSSKDAQVMFGPRALHI